LHAVRVIVAIQAYMLVCVSSPPRSDSLPHSSRRRVTEKHENPLHWVNWTQGADGSSLTVTASGAGYIELITSATATQYFW